MGSLYINYSYTAQSHKGPIILVQSIKRLILPLLPLRREKRRATKLACIQSPVSSFPNPLKHGRRRTPRITYPPQEPVRQPDELGPHALLPVPALLRRLDGVAQYAALAVEVEDEETREGLVGVDTAPSQTQGFGYALLRVVVIVVAVVAVAVVVARFVVDVIFGLALLAPPHDELVGHGAGASREECQRLGGHALGEDLELYVADYGDPVPCYRRCPQGGVVCDSAGYGGEVRVCGRE